MSTQIKLPGNEPTYYIATDEQFNDDYWEAVLGAGASGVIAIPVVSNDGQTRSLMLNTSAAPFWLLLRS